MEEKRHLVEQLDSARARMRAAIEGIDAGLKITRTWTIKEVIAHITGWDDATIDMLRAHASGSTVDASQWGGIDHYNAQAVEARQAMSYEAVLKEWEATREQLKALIDELPRQKLGEPLSCIWGQRGTVAMVVGIMAEHEAEHAHVVERLGP